MKKFLKYILTIITSIIVVDSIEIFYVHVSSSSVFSKVMVMFVSFLVTAQINKKYRGLCFSFCVVIMLSLFLKIIDSVTHVEIKAVQNRMNVLNGIIHAYELKHHKMPDSYGDLNIPESLYKDPFSSEPLKFFVDEQNRIIIYSLGPDGIDQHGQVDIPHFLVQRWLNDLISFHLLRLIIGSHIYQGDIVFKEEIQR